LGHLFGKLGHKIVEVLFRVGTVALLSGFEIDYPLKVLDTEAHHRLGMSFENREIDHEVAVEDITIKIKNHPSIDINLLKGSLEDIDRLNPIALFQDVVS